MRCCTFLRFYESICNAENEVDGNRGGRGSAKGVGGVKKQVSGRRAPETLHVSEHAPLLPFKNSLLLCISLSTKIRPREEGVGGQKRGRCVEERRGEKRERVALKGEGGQKVRKTQGNPEEGEREVRRNPHQIIWLGGILEGGGTRRGTGGQPRRPPGFCVGGFFIAICAHCAAVAPSVNGSRGGMVPGSGSECASEWRCVWGSGLWKEAGCRYAPARSSFPLGGKLCVCVFCVCMRSF